MEAVTQKFQNLDNIPIELVILVFEYLAASRVQPSCLRRGGYQHPDGIALLHVCKKWRQIVLSTPRIWTLIVVDMCPHLLDLALDFSLEGSLQLVIHLGDHVWQVPEYRSAISRLCAQMNRTTLLDIQFYHDSSASLPQLCEKEAPLLERLRIENRFSVWEPIPLPSTTFGGVRPPRLRHLFLRFCQLPWDLSLFHNLQTLILEQKLEYLEPTRLLDVLRATASLEILTLSEGLPTQWPANVIEDSVSLPLLRELRLLGSNVDACTSLLRSISCDLSFLSIRARVTESDFTVFFNTCAHRLRGPIDALKIDGNYFENVQLEGYVTTAGVRRSVFNIIIVETSDGYHATPPSESVVVGMNRLPVSEALTLHLAGGHHVLEDQVVSALCANLPKLRILDAAYVLPGDNFMKAFGGPVPSPIPFPLLESVLVPQESLPYAQAVVDARKSAGVPIILEARDPNAAPPSNLHNYTACLKCSPRDLGWTD
ncbi:hypothetical protein EYR40_004802 [Pleurotus pulmonarius]|nr:hypothetical protein EYR38_006166 [Pleurotus pulmonarius]KAF4601604.1 hypothetical protein EYR40_004802 [Pleurotus pulmonarius]